MKKLKSERHHWWPECVSQFWNDEGGCAHWVLPDETVRRSPAKNFGVIGNGHLIKLDSKSGEATVWDESYEAEFQMADDLFPGVIEWLSDLTREYRPDASRLGERFVPVASTDERLAALAEGIVSLVLRSPRTRENAVGIAEHLRGPLPEKERNSLIGANLRRKQRVLADSIGSRGKFAVIYSPDRELIFGDGFFHNIVPHSLAPTNAKIVVPLTPRIAAVFARPMQYTVEPKLTTLVVNSDEAVRLNHSIQVYARNAIFYRSQAPVVDDAFRQAKHLEYALPDNPIDSLIHAIPGVPPRDRSLDFFLGLTG